MRLALGVRGARSWMRAARDGHMGRQHRACVHDTGFWALRVCSPPATGLHSCDVAGGHDYVYENISSPARCELAAPVAPFPMAWFFGASPERPNLFGREP